MSVPYRFDDSNTERSGALASAAIGLTQAILAAREKASRGDVSTNMVGIGPSAPSQNPMQINAPLPAYAQPNPAPSPTASVPPKNVNALGIPATSPTPYQQPNTAAPAPVASAPPQDFNPMRVGASTNYQQPGTANPKPNPAGTVSKLNPMGL
jgi:hypothetical protein